MRWSALMGIGVICSNKVEPEQMKVKLSRQQELEQKQKHKMGTPTKDSGDVPVVTNEELYKILTTLAVKNYANDAMVN